MSKSLDFTQKIYTLNDTPKKREYLFNRVKGIYPKLKDKKINKILDNVKIRFRKQDEKGASNHETEFIYVSFNEIKKYKIKNESDFLEYLNNPKSIITHEVMHIFQNILEIFPDINYMSKDESGKRDIDYEKYVTDQGEIQSRLEQIIELIKWGFDKEEIVQFLYNRSHNDKDMWRDLVDSAKEIKKDSSSHLPGIDDDENVTNELGREPIEEFEKDKDTGRNYDRSYR